MSKSQAARSAGVSATSKAEIAGMTIKHITVHPNAQVAQSVEQRTENPRVGSSILSLGTNSLFSLCTYPNALTASKPKSICCLIQLRADLYARGQGQMRKAAVRQARRTNEACPNYHSAGQDLAPGFILGTPHSLAKVH